MIEIRKIPIYVPEVCPDAPNCRKCRQIDVQKQYICSSLGRDVSQKRVDDHINQSIKTINAWNKCIKKIPQISAYELQGITQWRISMFKLVPNNWESEFNKKEWKKEAKLLLDSGFNLGYNEDYGVGDIITGGDKYTVKKHVYGLVSYPVENGTFDDVIDWIWDYIHHDG